MNSLEQEIKDCFLKPTTSRLIVREDEYVEPSKVIFTPDVAKRRPTTGIVVSIGAGITEVTVGRRVVYAQFSGTLVQFRARPAYRILSQEEILAMVDLDDVYLQEATA